MAMEFEIVPARWPQDIGHVQGLLAHYAQFLAASPVGATGVCLIGFEEELRTIPTKYRGSDADILLARLHGTAAGCVAIAKRVLEDGAPAAEMKRLWVEPDFRGHGLGRALVSAAVGWARTHGRTAVVLDTIHNAMPEAGALYRSLGFQETARFNDNPLPGVRFYLLQL
jgi:putative acetyltransferase